MKHVHIKPRLLFLAAYVHGYLGASDYTSGQVSIFCFIAAALFLAAGIIVTVRDYDAELYEQEKIEAQRKQVASALETRQHMSNRWR